jgi:hypothetical protein
MRTVILLMVLVAMSYTSVYSSEIIEVPLPDLIGFYSNTTRTCEFELDIAPTEVYAVWIRYSGTLNAGAQYCYIGGPDPVGPDSMGIGFNATMRDTVSGDLWIADRFTENESGSFEMTVQFEPTLIGEPTWEFLIAGGGKVSCLGYSSPTIPDCYYNPEPTATIEEATLIIEGEFPVATETNTWGRIKALLK